MGPHLLFFLLPYTLQCPPPESVHAHAPPWPTLTVFKKTNTNTHTFLLVFKEKALVSNICLVSLNLKTSAQVICLSTLNNHSPY